MVSYQKLTSLNPWNYYFCVAGRIRCYLRRWSWSENCKRRVKCRIRPRYGTSQLDFFFFCVMITLLLFLKMIVRDLDLFHTYMISLDIRLYSSLNFRLNRFDFGVLTIDFWLLSFVHNFWFSIFDSRLGVRIRLIVTTEIVILLV